MDYNQELLNALSESYQQSEDEASESKNNNEAGSSDTKKSTTKFSKDQLKEISEILANIQVPGIFWYIYIYFLINITIIYIFFI